MTVRYDSEGVSMNKRKPFRGHSVDDVGTIRFTSQNYIHNIALHATGIFYFVS